MKKQKVFVFTELYGNDSDTEVNVLGVYATKTMAKDMLAYKKQEVLESYEQAFSGEYEVSEDYVVNVQEELSFISKEKLFNSTAGKIISSLHIERQRILNYAKDETKNIKDYFYVQFDEVDKILAAKANELSAALQSEDSAKKALEKARELLSKLTAVKQELEAILEV